MKRIILGVLASFILPTMAPACENAVFVAPTTAAVAQQSCAVAAQARVQAMILDVYAAAVPLQVQAVVAQKVVVQRRGVFPLFSRSRSVSRARVSTVTRGF